MALPAIATDLRIRAGRPRRPRRGGDPDQVAREAAMGWAAWIADDDAMGALDMGADPVEVLRQVRVRLARLQAAMEHALSFSLSGLAAVRGRLVQLKVLKLLVAITMDIHILGQVDR